MSIPLSTASVQISFKIYSVRSFYCAFFQPCASNSCRHSLSAATVWCCWPLSSSTGANWGFKWLPQGHHSGVCWGSWECCSFIFHTSTSPRLSVLKSYIASKKNNPFLSLCDTSPTIYVCVCARLCVCACMHGHFSASFVLTLPILLSVFCVPLQPAV